MAIQSFFEFINPLLLYLARQPGDVQVADAYEAVADAAGVSEQDREILLPSQGQAVYKAGSGGPMIVSSEPDIP